MQGEVGKGGDEGGPDCMEPGKAVVDHAQGTARFSPLHKNTVYWSDFNEEG